PGGDPDQFAFRRPCAPAPGATVALDTTALPDGAHTIAVKGDDAAGNTVTALGPETRVVDNVPSPTPPPRPKPAAPAPPRPALVAAWLERGHRRGFELTADYGERVRLRGRVTGAAGAAL